MYTIEKFLDKKVLKSDFLNFANVEAFFTTRDLPLKYGERTDLIPQIEFNKNLICKGFGISRDRLFIPQQTHSDNVEVINLNKTEYPQCDGLVTNLKDVAIALNFADCVPLIFYDNTKHVIAVTHAGWRGTAARIAVKTVEIMKLNFGCCAQNITALIGPAIGICCFEVKQDVLDKIKMSINTKYNDAISGMFVDLKRVNEIQLLAEGLKNIDVCEYCTSCKNELFFSYRKEKGNTARHSAVIMMK